jgi:hypothetical protein
MAKTRNMPEGYDVGGLVIGGSALLGLGIGATQDQAGAGLLIGLGIGLILTALIRLWPRNL